MPLHQVQLEGAAKTGRQIGALSDTTQHFLPPGMDMVLDFITKAIFPKTEEDVMQQMSDSVLADLALGIQIPGQKEALASILEDTFGQTKKAMGSARSEKQLGKNLIEEFGSAAHVITESRVAPISILEEDTSNTLAMMFTPGGRSAHPKGGVENQIISLLAGHPAGLGGPNAQMFLSDAALSANTPNLVRRTLQGSLPQDQLVAHELAHILEQGVPINTARELLEQPQFVSALNSMLRDIGRRDVLGSGNRLFRFSEGLASFLESGQRLPRSVTNRVPQIEGLDELILEMVKDLK